MSYVKGEDGKYRPRNRNVRRRAQQIAQSLILHELVEGDTRDQEFVMALRRISVRVGGIDFGALWKAAGK